ncbi:polysaccharide lyase, partial [Pseudomonas stutzeri]|nr:polysaccharide lyase [Stutzerimonas stutzeri]
VALVQANLPKAMGLVTAKDGIYADGSFIQHTFFPYNGSYGNEMIKGIARISSTLVGTPWAISEVQFANVFNLIDKGFLQLMVNGRMPSMVSGRSISRAPGTNPETTELETGKETLANLTLIAEAAPAGLKQKIYQAVATWVAQVGDYYNFFNNPRDYAALNGLKTALSQATAQENDQDSLNVYGSMDRVMQKTSRYAGGLAMYSNRI